MYTVNMQLPRLFLHEHQILIKLPVQTVVLLSDLRHLFFKIAEKARHVIVVTVPGFDLVIAQLFLLRVDSWTIVLVNVSLHLLKGVV